MYAKLLRNRNRLFAPVPLRKEQRMSFGLIALDIDGTLLNSRKEVAPETLQAVREVCAAGKAVAFDTGRAVCELTDLFELLPEVRYAVFASGAGIYNVRKSRTFALRGVSREDADLIFSLARTKDVMPQIVLADADVIQASHLAHLERYHMGIYRPLYEKTMTLVPDIYSFAASCTDTMLKINLYHANPEERIRTNDRLSSLNIETVYSEASSLECSARGVDKGSGLLRLCGELGIPPEQSVACGDADNDIPMLKAAGLGIAMGNAAAHIKTAADLVVSDLDHGGCAQAIRMLLSP